MKLRLLLLSVLSILVLVPLASSVPAVAQNAEPAALDNVTLWLYPEYDDPRLLVMLEGQAVGATLPATIRFLVPEDAEMYSAGSKDAQGKYSGGPPERKSSNIPGWDEISYRLPNPTFRMEYYTDQIQGLPDKQIAFDFHPVYPIRNLRVVAQQPLRGSGLAVTPNGTASQEGSFDVQVLNFSNLSPDPAKPLHLDISYTKSDLGLSVNAAPGSVPPLVGSGDTGSSGLSVPLILGLVAAALAIAGVFYWLGASRRSQLRYAESGAASRASRKNGQPYRSQNKPAPPQTERPTPRERRIKTKDFCDQCGSNLDKNDRFCPSCGTKLE